MFTWVAGQVADSGVGGCGFTKDVNFKLGGSPND